MRTASEIATEFRFVDGQDEPYERAPEQTITAARIEVVQRLREMATEKIAGEAWLRDRDCHGAADQTAQETGSMFVAADLLEAEIREAGE